MKSLLKPRSFPVGWLKKHHFKVEIVQYDSIVPNMTDLNLLRVWKCGHTAVSTRVVQQKCKSVGDNAGWYYWVARICRCLIEFHSGLSNRKILITHNHFRHCRVSFSSFVRQPFSKQLYDAMFPP